MRLVASLVLLAGCDVLFQLQDVRRPPDGGDSLDAPPPDAKPPPPVLCSLPTSWNLATVGSGSFYSVDAGGTIAAYSSGTNIFITTPGAVGGVQPFAGMTGLRIPRLAPSGRELFLHQSSPCCTIVVSKLDAGAWTTPTPINVKNLAIGTDELPGIPTSGEFAKRRLVVSVSGTDQLYEMVEETDGWSVAFNYKDQTLGVASVQDANLSPDGYRMVFAGTKTAGGTERIFAVDRTDLKQPFTAAAVVQLHDSGQAASLLRAPQVSGDCQDLWFSFGTAPGTIRRGSPQ